jgi:hypothetical protein
MAYYFEEHVRPECAAAERPVRSWSVGPEHSVCLAMAWQRGSASPACRVNGSVATRPRRFRRPWLYVFHVLDVFGEHVQRTLRGDDQAHEQMIHLATGGATPEPAAACAFA